MHFNLLLNDILKAENSVMIQPKIDKTHWGMFAWLLKGLYLLRRQGLHEVSIVYVLVRSISILCENVDM